MAIDDDTKSCSSRAIAAAESSPAAMAMAPRAVKHQMLKLDVYNDVLRRLQDWDFEEASVVGFEDQLWQHFNRLPARYALDVNVERAEDVLMHMRFLRQALDPANRPVFEVRLVQVNPISNSSPSDSVDSFSFGNDGSHRSIKKARSLSLHPPPTFGSSQNLEALALQSSETNSEDGYFTDDTDFDIGRAMHEITFSTVDKPKLLNQLTSLLSDIGLNIQEAHAFSTIDGFSLDVFVVDGWPIKETEQLRILLDKELRKTKKLTQLEQSTSVDKECKEGFQNLTDVGNRSKSKGGEQEIDPGLLKLGNKVGSGTSGDLYKGTYNEQEVAIKILKADRVNKDVLKEFFQEVNILRKIRHKNIVQFSGACTQPPNLCIVTEFMARGNVYNFLHKQRGVFKLPSLIRAAIDVSQGMEYLDQNNIVHRDLKSANLLMTEDGVIKIADFGIARVHSHTGVMTAETGTYRWMAPEVIEHKPYDHKADVFSFGIVLWELLTGELPYAHLTPLQAAVGVVQKGLRPAIPKNTNPKLVDLLTECWHQDPAARPNFSQMIKTLHEIADVISQR